MFEEQVSTIGGSCCGFTVTAKLQLVQVPHVSHAEQVTVVVPTGNVLPLGGLHVRLGGGLHPPLAVEL
jgi:hypothetical protein